ncbi:MAG: outer membrane protein assembly factor BamA [Akkermansiaceae bacterium]|jgi:outer membrane protein assembly factor BamA
MRTFSTLLILALVSPLPAAEIEFVGLRSYTKKALEEAIAGRLDYISKRPATSFRADDAAFLVESYLRTHGLPDATVAWNLPPGDTIVLTVEEGLPKFLGTLNVQGYEDAEAVQNQFKAPFPESEEKRAFEAEAIDTGLTRVRDLLHADGYWQATVTSTQGTRTATGEIPFILQVTLGPLFTLFPPTLKTPVPPTAKLRQHLQDVLGKEATAETIVAIRKTIAESYRRRGYTDIGLDMSKESDGSRLRLAFTLTPGEKFTVRSFNLAGLQETVPSRVRNRFVGLVGETFNENRVNDEIKKLLSTGAFESIRLNSKEFNETQLDLTLHLSEAKARGYSFALGFGSIEGYVVGARYYNRNLWGRLWNLSAGIEVTSLGLLGEVTLTDPFFLGRDLSMNNRTFLITRDYDSYRKFQGGGSTEFSWKKGKYYSATAGAEVSINAISSTLPDELIGPTNYLNHRLSFRQKYDRRDDPTLPSDGWFARLDAVLGLVNGDTNIGYLETNAQLSYYHSLGESSAYALGLRGGLIYTSSEENELPIDLRKFLGGANTVRSFPERQMGPQFDSSPLGGNSWWVANAEYTRTLKGPLKGLVFLDAGALDDDLELAAGLGIRIDLPVGPIRFEYGRSLSRDDREPSGAFHFAIGTTF